MPGSVASDGSAGASSVGSMHEGADHHEGHEDDQDVLDTNMGVEAAVFGVVYTLSKDKMEQSNKFAAFRIVIDFLQIFILIVDPSFGWHINEKSWAWKYLLYVQLKSPVIRKGYGFYIAVLYATVAMIVVTALLCFYAGWCFKTDRLPYRWPIKLLRFLVTVFFVVFYVGTLSLLLTALQCHWFTPHKSQRFKLQHFGKDCIAMPHMLHAFVAALAIALFIAITAALTLADYELKPISSDWLATSDASLQLRGVVLRTIIMFAATLLDGHRRLQAVVIAVAMWLLFWGRIYRMPHYIKWVNHVRTGLYCGLTWAALMLLVLAIPEQHPTHHHLRKSTNTMLAAFAPFILFGFLLSYARYEVFFQRGIRAFRSMDAQQNLKYIYLFSHDFEVEVLSRCCRQWVDEDTLAEDAVQLADLVIRAGIARLGSSNVNLVILQSNFLIEVQGAYQAGLSQLQAAKKLRPNLLQRFAIFAREQMHRQRALSQSSADGGLDLSSYVEFQRTFRSVLRHHKAALFCMRHFWKQLLGYHVSFSALTKAFENIQKTQDRAERTYHMVLERYPSSAKLLRGYGRFLEEVKHDPWRASKCYAEAEKIEEEGDQGMGTGGFPSDDFSDEDASIVGQLNDTTAAVIVINAAGMILVANKLAQTMFGYKKDEMEGKNISMLMPQPFSQRHDSFLRNYIQTGKARIINTIRDVVGLHKDRTVFPMQVAVAKASGTGNDSVFIGICMPAPRNADVVRCWVMPNGVILCVNEQFTDWFGKSHKDILGTTFDTLAVEQDRMQELIETANKATEAEFKAGHVAVHGVRMLHKYVDSIECDIICSLGGTDAQRLLVMDIKRLSTNAAASSMFVTDAKGHIIFATSGFASLLGYQPSEMVNRLALHNLMNPPFSHLHTKWLQDLPPKIPLTSCRNSSAVVAVTATGAAIPVRLSVDQREVAGENIFLVRMWRSTFEEGLELRRVSFMISQEGIVTEAIGHSPMAIFGFKPSSLMGSPVTQFVRAFHDLVDKQHIPLKDVIASVAAASVAAPGISWRVGIHAPVSDEKAREMEQSDTAKAIFRSQIRPSVMEVHAAVDEDEGAVSLRLNLYRTDAITGIIMLDRGGHITKAGCCPLHMPGLIFGVSSPSMVRQPLSKYIDLGGRGFQEALFAQPGEGKKAMKAPKGKAAIKMGPVKKLLAFHADGDSQTVTVQAVPTDSSGRRTVVRINITHEPLRLFHGVQRTVLASKGVTLDAETAGHKEQRQAGAVDQEAETAGGVRSRPTLEDDAPPDNAPAPTAAAAAADGAGTNMRALVTEMPAAGADDGASQASGSQGGSSFALGDNEQGADYRRGKQYRKLRKLLCGKRTQQSFSRFYQRTSLVMGIQMTIHLICFALFAKFIIDLNSYVYDVDAAGKASDMLHRMAMNTLILRELHRGREAPGIYQTSDIPYFTSLFRDRIDAFEHVHTGIFLGFKRMRQLQNLKNTKLKDLWEKPSMNATFLADIKHPEVTNVTLSFWELGNHYIMAAREVLSNHDRMAGSATQFSANTTDLQANRFWQFVVTNGPASLFEGYTRVLDGLVTRAMDKVDQVNTIAISLLVLEGCLVGCVAITTMSILMRQVMNLRYRMFAAFLMVPAGFLRALSLKRIQVDEDEAENSGSEDGDYQVDTDTTQGAKGADSGQVYLQLEIQAKLNAAGHSSFTWLKRAADAVVQLVAGDHGDMNVSKRTLKRDAHHTRYLLIPQVVWSGLVLSVYSSSYATLHKSSTGLIANSVSNSFIFWVVRAIFWTLNVCSRETAALKEEAQATLHLSVDRLDSVYNTLMYGSKPGGFNDSQYHIAGTAFDPMSPVNLFFRSRGKCLRSNQAACRNSTNVYYQASTNGLDAMVLRLVEESHLLGRDLPNMVNMSNSRCDFIWKVANFDLYEGAQAAEAMYTKQVLASFKKALAMHIVLFVMSWAGAFVFLVFIIKPFLRRLQGDSQRVAELLSQLPSDIDVEGLVSHAMGYAGAADDDENEESGKVKRRSHTQAPQEDKAPAADEATGRRSRRTSFSIPEDSSRLD